MIGGSQRKKRMVKREKEPEGIPTKPSRAGGNINTYKFKQPTESCTGRRPHITVKLILDKIIVKQHITYRRKRDINTGRPSCQKPWGQNTVE